MNGGCLCRHCRSPLSFGPLATILHGSVGDVGVGSSSGQQWAGASRREQAWAGPSIRGIWQFPLPLRWLKSSTGQTTCLGLRMGIYRSSIVCMSAADMIDQARIDVALYISFVSAVCPACPLHLHFNFQLPTSTLHLAPFNFKPQTPDIKSINICHVTCERPTGNGQRAMGSGTAFDWLHIASCADTAGATCISIIKKSCC